jgi:hypothetical protein
MVISRDKLFNYIGFKIFIIYFFLSFTLLASPVEQPPPAEEICKDQPQCDFIGTNRQWPSDGFDIPTTIFSNQMFDIELPSKLNRVSIGWGKTPLYVVWYKDNRISFGIEEVPNESTSTDYPAILKQKNQTEWVPNDIFKIIFTKNNPTNKEPENAYEKYLWRTAFFRKVMYYKSPSDAYIYNNGPWNAYSAIFDTQSKNRLTVVTHKEYPSRHLMIINNGTEIDFIEKILATIRLNLKVTKSN